MAIIQQTSLGMRRDPDTIRIVDWADSDLSHYFEVNVDETNNLVDFLAKIGDFRFKDVDDSGNLDTFKIVGDPAASGIIKKTSNILDSTVFLLQATGTISGAAVTVDIDYFKLDLDALVLNDGATQAITLRALAIDWNGLTATAVGLSTLRSINLEHPTTGVFATENVFNITADKTVANNAQVITTSRDINGIVTGAVALTNYSTVLGQAVSHTGGDFIVTQIASTAGILNLILAHTTSLATTAPDVFASTALNIDINALVDTDAGADLDMSARAVDISYTLTETLGVLRMAATDIARITATIPNGLSSAGAFQFDMFELNADGVVINDANLTFNGLYFDASGATLTAGAGAYGISVLMPTSVGVALERAALKTSDGTNTVHLSNGSVGVSATGINDEKYFFMEDFDQEVAAVTLDAGLHADEWTFGGNVGAAADVTYIAGAGGILQISSTAIDDQSTGAYWIVDNIYIDSNPIIEFRFRVDDVGAAQMGCLLGLTETVNILSINGIAAVSDDIIAIGMNSDLANPEKLRMWTNDTGAAETVVDLGVTLVVNQWCTVRIDCTDTEQPRVWVNVSGGAISPDDEIVAATITGTIQAGIAMIPFIFIHCLDATPAEHHMEIDYVKIWQNRS